MQVRTTRSEDRGHFRHESADDRYCGYDAGYEDDPRSLAEELVDTGKDCMVIFELQAPAEEAESDESDGI